MYMVTGLGAAANIDACETACVDNFTTPDAYYQCIADCEAIFPPGVQTTTTLPPGVTPTTTSNLPPGLTPPTGYQPPTPATNWWRVSAAVVLGLSVGVVLGLQSKIRGAAHAA